MADNIIKDVFGFGLLAVGAYFVYEWFFAPGASNFIVPTTGTVAPGVTPSGSPTSNTAITCTSPQVLNAAGNGCITPTNTVSGGGSTSGNGAGANNSPSFTYPSLSDSPSGSRAVIDLINEATLVGGQASTTTMMNIDQWAYYFNQIGGIYPVISPGIMNSMIVAEGGDRTRLMTAGQFAQLYSFINNSSGGMAGFPGTGFPALGRVYAGGYGGMNGLGIIGKGYNVNGLNTNSDASAYELSVKSFR